MRKISEQEFNNTKFAELAPTIDLIVRQDEIYKQIHNIPLNQKVAYPHSVLIAGNSVEIGEIANTFRQIKQKYNFDNFEQVLLTKDAEVYVSQLTGMQKENKKQKTPTTEFISDKLNDVRAKVANRDNTCNNNIKENNSTKPISGIEKMISDKLFSMVND